METLGMYYYSEWGSTKLGLRMPTSKIWLALVLVLAFVPIPSFAHLYGLNVQEWTNQRFNIKIQFEPDPQTPSVGENSTLNFSVQDLATGEHLKNFTETVTVVYYDPSNPSSNSISYKFDSTNVADGDFARQYVFQKGGSYEVFLRVDTPTFIEVSRFTTFVSSPQFQAENLLYMLLPFILVMGAFGGIGYAIHKRLYKSGKPKS